MVTLYDIVLYDPTGFTGRLAALYVTQQYGKKVRWAVAGRSKEKLEAIKAECQGIPDVVIADSSDRAALNAMVSKTKVVVTFAGPFARYGSELVEACAVAGKGYCDITGESDWVREMIAKHDATARQSGARIVHLCGHDSLPWDILTMKLAAKLKEGNANSELTKIELWDDIRSRPSGGTMETAMGIMFGAEGKKKRSDEVQRLGYDPLLKLPSGAAADYKLSARNINTFQSASSSRKHNKARSMFVMAGVNANTVKRSNALNQYGKNVVYTEGTEHSSVFGACFSWLGLVAFGMGLFIPPIRWLLRSFVLPKPGEGPSEEFMATGYLNVTGVATGSDGQTAKATVRFSVDPGYKDTARMAVESGLALALEGDRCKNSGVLTPASCQGEVVLERLLKTGTAFEFY